MSDVADAVPHERGQETTSPKFVSPSYFPIFIPSKGRWNNRKGTVAQLISSAVPFTLVVEPQEAHLYEDLLRTLWLETSCSSGDIFSSETSLGCSVCVLPQSNQGVSYVRNFILHNLAPTSGWFWIMDDDIQGFHRGVDRVNVSIPANEVLLECSKRMQQYPEAAVFSIDYPFYAWQYDDAAAAINSYNNIAVMMNRALLPETIHYRFRIREDYDFTLQVILSGKTTVRFRNLSYRVPRMAGAAGGMTDYYEKQKSDIAKQNKLFLATWPSVSREVIKGTGDAMRLDMSVKWIALHPNRCADPAAVLRSTEPLNRAPLKEKKAPVVQAVKGKSRRLSSVSSSDIDEEYSETDSIDEEDLAIWRSSIARKSAPVKRERAPAIPKPPAPPREKVIPGWKGFAMEKYRDPSPSIVKEIGLVRIADTDVKLGHVVLIIPYDLSLPSVVPACIVEVTRYPAPKSWNWSAVIEQMRGAPVQTVSDCYRLESDDAHLESIVATLDAALIQEEGDM
jgi:hypothetical protein